MENEITLKNIINIYEKEISKNVKNKRKLYNFEINKFQNINNIIDMLKNGLVGHNKYNIFLINEPKCRLVMSLPVKDKIINHFIARFCLEKKLSKYLSDRNCATRKNMGTDYAIKLIKKYIEENKRKYKKFYILKMDIKKYFYNIDHNVLKELLEDKLNDYEYNMVCKIIDSTNKEYINEIINSINETKGIDMPTYEKEKGLPIGNVTSQILSIFYLYKLDHFIVHTLRLKYFVRYMDDIIIISNELDKLKKAKKILEEKLRKEYKLKINNKKTMITKSKEGFSFLGYTYKVIGNKTIIKIKKSNYNKINRRLKKVRKIKDYNKMFSTIMNYINGYKYANNRKILNIVDKWFYYEK